MITPLFIIFLGIFSVVSGFIFFLRSKSPYRWYALCKVIGVFYLTGIYTYFIIHRWLDFPASYIPIHASDFIFYFIRPGAIMFFSWLILDVYLRSWGKNDN